MTRTLYAFGALFAGTLLLMALIRAGMAQSGDAQLLAEAARETGAELIDQPLTPRQANLGSLEVAPWQAGEELEGALGSGGPKVKLVCFWASWCPPCVREWPSMLRLARRLGPDRLRVIAVSYDESWPAIRAFFEDHFGELPAKEQALLLRDGAEEPSAMQKTVFGTDKLPETYVVMNGRVLYRFVNERDWTSPAVVRFFESLLDAEP